MASPALEIAEYLEAEGIGVFGGDSAWSLHVSRQPDRPDEAVTLYDTGGGAPLAVDQDADDVDIDLRTPTIQLRVRGSDYEDVRARHELIRRALVIPEERTIGDGRYVAINATSDIIDAGADERDRYVMTANYAIIRQGLEEVT